MENIEGLIIHPNFITQEEEKQLVNAIRRKTWSNKLRRRTQHYGYEYHYTGHTVNKTQPIPKWGNTFIEKLIEEKIIENSPDQIIINEYKPGQGIGKHVDSLLFDDTVLSLSLLSACNFKFTNILDRTIHTIYLLPRTLLIMSGKSRYDWMHEIPSVKYDLVNEERIPRHVRISITFRYVKP